MAYRADIEIGVRGTRQLEQLRSLITQTTQAYESLNRIAKNRGGLVQNLANYTTQVDRARRAIDNVTMGSQAETKAIREYVTAMGQANTARARQNYLIELEIAGRRKVQATVNAGVGQQGPAVPPSMRNAGFGQQGPVLPSAANRRATSGGLGKAASGALSNAAVGGAFPLLFGQSGAASAGGAIGGAVGSLIPGIGGFGGSLIGTIIGEKAGQGNQIKELAADIGFSTEQTKLLSAAFTQAGREFDKFNASVQNIRGLSLAVEDQAKAIQLVSSLTENYGGQIDKITNAFTSALESGKVSQATLNQLTSQGIPIQQALADKYNVSRDTILEMAKDGKISVQDLIDTLVDLGNKGPAEITKTVTTFDKLKTSVENLGSAFVTLGSTILNALSPVLDWLGARIADIVNIASNAINEVARLVENVANGPQAAARASLKRGELPFGVEGVGKIIGQERLTKITQQASTGFAGMIDQKKLTALLLQQPEFKDAKPVQPPKLTSFNAPSQAAPSGGGKGDNAADKAAKAAAREAERVANIVRDQAAITEQKKLQAQYDQGLFVAEIAKDENLKIQLQREQEIGEISLQYSKLVNDEKAKGNSAAVKEAFAKTALVNIQLVELKTAQDLRRLEIKKEETYANMLEDLQYELDLKSAVTEEQRRQLEIAYEMAKLQKDPMLTDVQRAEIKRRKEQIAAPKTDQQNIKGKVGQLQDEIEQLTSASNLAITGAEAIGTAFANSFKGIIDGSMTAREALSSFFQSVASAFLDMAAQIIAKWITMTILNSVLALFPGGGKGGGNFSPAGAGDTGISWSDAITFQPRTKLAEGGYVNGPTNALIGEGGQSEYVIPASKMMQAMSNYSAGKRGSSVLGESTSMGDGGIAGSNAFTLETVVINNVEYATVDQVRAMSNAAAKQGAEGGFSKSMSSLRNSRSQRSRLGMR